MTTSVDSVTSLLRPFPPIIGVGASAGGLEALKLLVTSLPDEHGLAIVIVQHLDPDHESLMSELLSKCTKSPVQTAQDGMQIKPGHVYLIPHGKDLTVKNGCLHTHDFQKPRGTRRPIDRFFESLADEAAINGAAIVMSGTGSDGAAGIRAIKEHSGLVFVQDPEEAKYDGMPRSALETGAYDLVLPAGEMITVLGEYFARMGGIEPSHLTDKEFIDRVAKHVRFRTGHDFSNYKPATLLRRIAVRMSVLGVAEPKDYLKLLIDSPDEAGRLFRDVLINVTSFFRDSETFEKVREEVIPSLFENRDADDEIRVWIAGCSTGQEAYTFGMLLLEEAERVKLRPPIAIFATDIDVEALNVGREGLYPNAISTEVPEELLAKYFKPTSKGFQVRAELRELVRFSNQSLIKDPPFSRIDLVSCRNLLIYFDDTLQDTAISVFHYALREGGFLLLGNSENPTQADRYFDTVLRHHRLLKRKPGPSTRVDLHAPRGKVAGLASEDIGSGPRDTISPPERELLKHFAPPYMVLNGGREVVYTSEDAAHFLEFRGGQTKLKITQVIHPALDAAIRRLLNQPLAEDGTNTVDFEGDFRGSPVRIDLSCSVMDGDGRMIVLRQYLTPSNGTGSLEIAPESSVDASYVKNLEDDLEEARETIRTTVEELETSNEELKSSNEEMMSMNEELQSANEELRTSNDELNGKIKEVRQANLDLSNFIHSTEIATVFLNRDMTLRNFTPEATKIFRFHQQDKGRDIADLGSTIPMESLVEDCQRVAETRTLIETEYTTRDDSRVYNARIVPYEASADMDDEGVVFTLVDVTELRQLAREALDQARIARHALAEVEQIYEASPQAMGLIGPDLKYLRVNRQLAELTGLDAATHIGMPVNDVLPDLRDQMSGPVQKVLDTKQPISNQRVMGKTLGSEGAERIFEADWFPVFDGDTTVGVGMNLRDITDREQMAFELRRVMQELQHRVKNMLANVQALISRARRDATADYGIFAALSRRVQALSQTHKLLTEKNWGAAKLLGVIGPELLDVYGTDRVTLRGPEIEINARSALSFGMTVHELATNAAKYGALSADDGHVTFSWVRQDDGENDDFIFVWKESGGPTPPENVAFGFGSQLIYSTIEGSLSGTVEFIWEPDGLRCVMTVPATALTEVPHETVFDVVST